MPDERVEYLFVKGEGWIPIPLRYQAACWNCGSTNIYCCEASPFYDTFDYWVEQGRLLIAETRP